eukprot:1239061-Alexandrium_andersonii.AAC.1
MCIRDSRWCPSWGSTSPLRPRAHHARPWGYSNAADWTPGRVRSADTTTRKARAYIRRFRS